MPWYKAGTVSVTQNSNAVIGTGTAFIANGRVGDAFRGPDGDWYEVTNIASDTALSISPNYQGATTAAGAYALAPMQGYVKDSADALRALVNQFGGVLAVLGVTPTTDGVRDALNLTSTDGLPEGLANKYMTAAGVRGTTLTGLDLAVKTPVVSTDSVLAALGKLQAGKAASGVNSDITELSGLTKPITASQGGLSSGYVEGLYLSWVSATSISLGGGAAYIPSTGKTIQVTTPIVVSGLALAASSWYYVYLYENAGAPAVEVVATVPTATYTGTARMKTGDSSRRYLGALKTNASGQVYQFQHEPTGFIHWLSATNATPFRVLNGGVQTVPVAFALSPAVPPVSFTALLNISPNTTPALLYPASALGQQIRQQTATAVSAGLVFPLDSTQRMGYAVLSGGSVIIDVCGFLNER